MNVGKNCLKCKGRLQCGASFCPIIAKAAARVRVVDALEKPEFSGEAPTVFVGRIGYPFVNVGLMSTQAENSEIYDAPRTWSAENYEIPRIIDLRSGLINSRFQSNVREKSKFLELSQEVAMASKPADVDITLKEKPKVKISFKSNEAPMGPSAKLVKAELTENTKIDKKVDYVVSDYDFKATDALAYLQERGFDENFLSKLLSIGNLGVKSQRKLVPTRWSITATDDMLAKNLIAEIKDFPMINDHIAFFGNYLGNYYLILMFPEVWSYELFETYMPKTSWNTEDKINFMTDNEGYEGRKDYAENCSGGYYSVRLAILEKLKQLKRQASVLALRFITDDYYLPLGVWVTREATRKALMNKPIAFDSKERLLHYAKLLAQKRWSYDAENLLKESKLLNEIKQQSKLSRFA
jgi:hypothetical protein